jgi:GntR family transcriptional regulator, transcriptional repressor for pyruvate dehydrogenase complex
MTSRVAGERASATPLSQTDVVISELKRLVLDGVLGPGSRLPIEKELAAQLGVSRGSLREGVRALVHLGVLETRQGDGTYVTELDASRLLSPLGFLAELPTPGNSAQLLGVRRILEAESASLAALSIDGAGLDALAGALQRADAALTPTGTDVEAFLDADTDFHLIIARATGNPALAALIEHLIGRTERTRVIRAMSDHGAVRATQAEHYAILDQLRRHDPQRARIRMEAHLLGVEEFARSHPNGTIGEVSADRERQSAPHGY